MPLRSSAAALAPSSMTSATIGYSRSSAVAAFRRLLNSQAPAPTTTTAAAMPPIMPVLTPPETGALTAPISCSQPMLCEVSDGLLFAGRMQ